VLTFAFAVVSAVEVEILDPIVTHANASRSRVNRCRSGNLEATPGLAVTRPIELAWKEL